MIETEQGDYNLVHFFLAKRDREALEDLASECHEWSHGRQGSGYWKLDIKEYCQYKTQPLLHLMWQRALGELNLFSRVEVDQENTDAFLLFYPDGSYIPQHHDPVERHLRHIRINAVVVDADENGQLMLVGREQNHYPVVKTGDAIVFSPSQTAHSVSHVRGRRLVFSVGAVVDL